MLKHMIFYWYVNPDGWHEIYDLHIKYLREYKNSFDKVTFVISTDDECDEKYVADIENTIKILKDIYKDGEIIKYKNDKNLRESSYFYNEVALKLSSFKDEEIVFFAHNKGAFSWYCSKEGVHEWVQTMYTKNLDDIPMIETIFTNENICSVGTKLVRNLKPWKFLKYNWHYSGTFMWFSPKRVLKNINDNHEVIPQNDRYFTEGFLGSVIQDSDTKRVGL